MRPHLSHVTRISDASSFDEICVNCGAHDEIGSWGTLVDLCPNPVGKGGMTLEEWFESHRTFLSKTT